MANDYLNGYLSILPESQKQRILNMINKSEDSSGKTEAELEQMIRGIIDDLGKGQSVFQYRQQGDQTNSEEFNTMLKEIYADLQVLYNESGNIDKLITNNHTLNLSILKSVEKDISMIERKIETLNLIADNSEGYNSAKRDTFIDRGLSESEKKPNLFKDKDGTQRPMAAINDRDGTLSLAGHEVSNPMKGATIKIIDQVGSGFRVSDGAHDIANAIDESDSSFWGEVILADEPLKVQLDTAPIGLGIGAVCIYKISFPGPAMISEISFRPYTEFPLEIAKIQYTSDTTDTPSGTILEYDTFNSTLITESTTIKFPSVTAYGLIITVRQSHATKNTYIVTKDQINNVEMWKQITAAETNLTLSDTGVGDGSDLTANPQLRSVDEYDETWKAYQKAVSDFDKHKNEYILTGALAITGAAAIVNPASLIYAPATIGATSIAIDANVEAFKNMIIPSPERMQVDKYEYVYGMYDMKASGMTYDPISIYTSVKHEVAGNVQAVVLEANEWHPLFHDSQGNTIKKFGGEADLRRTSVEYYVSHRDEPTEQEWFPILPINLAADGVNNEQLFVSPDSRRAKLRWKVDRTKAFRAYRDEMPLVYGTDWEFDTSTDIVCIRPSAYSVGTYTIDYYPDGDPTIVNFDKIARPIGYREVFPNGCDRNNSVKLKYYPYTNKDRIRTDPDYNPVDIVLQGTIETKTAPAITGPIKSTRNQEKLKLERARLLNVTNYTEFAIPELIAYDPVNQTPPTFQYCHDGKRVYFTERFSTDVSSLEENFVSSHGPASIAVAYEYLVSGVRVKIVLRRTSYADPSITPIVYDYTLKFRCLV